MAPRTGFGKVALVVYALIGIPINMIFLQGIGNQMTRLAARVNRLRVCARRPTVSRVLNMFFICLAGASLLFIGPTFVFLYAEQWSILEGLYFCFVTLSTIGLGDYIAGKLLLLFCCCCCCVTSFSAKPLHTLHEHYKLNTLE